MKKKIAIVGGGTSALFLAAFLDSNLFEVSIYEKKSTVGRKFLVAGDGGFNLSHAENTDYFLDRYTPTDFLRETVLNFGAQDLRDWLASIGIETFVGSSKRIFPVKGIKPIQVLNAILDQLDKKCVHILENHTFTGWNENGEIIFNDQEIVKSDLVVFALGGASWKKTGSDGAWLNTFRSKEIDTVGFVAQNCAFKIAWPSSFIESFAGQPLKNIAITFASQTQKGEMVITDFGLEGNAIYALSPKIQSTLAQQQSAKILIDFKPMLSQDELAKKISSGQKNTSATLKKSIKLPAPVISLLRNHLSKEEYLNVDFLAEHIKNFPLEVLAAAHIDEAISTSGGVALSAVDNDYELRFMKNHFCIGEMLDWSAPTGGYLIQACASMGVGLANALNKRFGME